MSCRKRFSRPRLNRSKVISTHLNIIKLAPKSIKNETNSLNTRKTLPKMYYIIFGRVFFLKNKEKNVVFVL